MPVQISRKVTVEERYKMFLQLFNTLYSVGLSDNEIRVLDELYWASSGVLSTEARKQVAENMAITPFNLNNYVKKLRDKGMIQVSTEADKPDQLIKPLMIDLEPSAREFALIFKLEA